MHFSYEKRFGGLEAVRVETIFEQAATTKWGGQEIYERLKAQGLGYRKTVMLEDYRHFQAVYQSQSPEARERAESWYEKVYEPFRKEAGYTAKQATAALKNIREGTIETVEQAEESRDYGERYEEAFA